MIVLDASAAIELVLRSEAGRAVEERISAESLHAPQLLLIEAAQVLRRLAQRREITVERAGQALGDLRDLDVELYGHEPLVDRVWAWRGNLTAYDAAYVALAAALDAPLVTFDRGLVNAPGHAAVVELLAAT